MAKIRDMTPAAIRKTPPEQDGKIIIHKTEEAKLPDPPEIPSGKMGFRMVYHTGEFRDIIGESRFGCMGAAQKQAAQDKMNFGTDVISYRKI